VDNRQDSAKKQQIVGEHREASLAPRSIMEVTKRLWYTLRTAHEFLTRFRLLEMFPGQEDPVAYKVFYFLTDRSP
jgi:hypothetical protein